MDTPQLNVISLCSGYGGLDLGFARGVSGNVSHVAYCEREAYALGVLLARIEEGCLPSAPVWTDLGTFPFGRFRDVANLAILGGFPCQPFSASGKRTIDQGEPDPRHLWPHIRRGIGECSPSLVFLENVDAIASSKLHGKPETSVLWHVLQELEGMGYYTEATSISAREGGGLPHHRRRWFILAVLADSDDCAGLRNCRDVARVSRAPSEVQGEGGEPAQETGCSGSRPGEYFDCLPVARPGQAQYEWEYPRILVEHAEGERRERAERERDSAGESEESFGDASLPVSDTEGEQDGGEYESRLRRLLDGSCYGSQGSDVAEAQSAVDCSTDGTACELGDDTALLGESSLNYTGKKLEFIMKYRQRALRLLGNGVVPHQAERAIRLLAPRIALRATGKVLPTR